MKYLNNHIPVLSIFILLLSSLASAQTVSISADTTRGCGKLTVKFSYKPQSSTDNSWEWNFGNGQTSSEQNPSKVIFDSAGNYDVKLILNKKDTIESKGLIVVHPAAIALFTFADTSSKISFSRKFTFTKAAADTNSYTYVWDFGDNAAKDYTEQPVHAYSAPGLYPVTLKISNSFGCKDSTVQTVGIFETFDVPNVFTPNNDGNNDYFQVVSDHNEPLSIEIYDKYGTLVFKETSPTISWDGRTDSGVDMNSGIYFYVLKTAGSSASSKQCGFFYLYR